MEQNSWLNVNSSQSGKIPICLSIVDIKYTTYIENKSCSDMIHVEPSTAEAKFVYGLRRVFFKWCRMPQYTIAISAHWVYMVYSVSLLEYLYFRLHIRPMYALFCLLLYIDTLYCITSLLMLPIVKQHVTSRFFLYTLYTTLCILYSMRKESASSGRILWRRRYAFPFNWRTKSEI